jgi:thiol:disulfide interchange protein
LEYSTEKIEDIYTNSFVFKLTIKRRALYYGVMVIAPTVLFALLNPLVFLLPIESGERVSLAMTILLSYAIFLTLVSSSIPASSNPMCALLIVMIIIIVVSGIIVLGVIITVKYFNEENEDKIGQTLKRVVMWQLPKDNDVGGPLEV